MNFVISFPDLFFTKLTLVTIQPQYKHALEAIFVYILVGLFACLTNFSMVSVRSQNITSIGPYKLHETKSSRDSWNHNILFW